jgi:hypothetical protein
MLKNHRFMRQFSVTACLLLIMALFSNTGRAQEGDVYVSLAGGVSIPLADYAATDFSRETSGFAKPGGNFTIHFGYRLNEYLSLCGLLSGGVNRFDYISVQDELNKIYNDVLPDTRWVVETKSWGLGGLLAGLNASLPLQARRLYLEARLLGGFIYAYSPAVYISGLESGAEDKTITIEQSAAPAWSFDAGAGFRYQRSKKQYFTLYADYVYAQPYFKDVRTNSNFAYERDDAYSQKTGALNITLGIGYIVN